MSLEDLERAVDDERMDPTSHMEWAVEEIKRLRTALTTITLWDAGPDGSTNAERSMRRIAEHAIAQKEDLK